MSMDALKNKIRRLRNPSALTIAPTPDLVPPAILAEVGDPVRAMGEYCCRALEALKGQIPAVKVSFGAFVLHGPEGLVELRRVLEEAERQGYYVILDWQHQEDETLAKVSAKALFGGGWKCDGVTVCAYAGSASIKPYIQEAFLGKKDVYVVLKTGGKSGSELQDLQTGGRTVYSAGADMLAKMADSAMDRCGYSRVAAVCAANHANSIRNLRMKYPKLFLLVDGLEASNANARNASFAFDNMGYGALVCANLLGAWLENPAGDPMEELLAAVGRMKRNITTYVMVL